MRVTESFFFRSHAGQVSFPGGRCDGEETVIETALRETEEEIGLGSGDVHVWTVMPSVPGRCGGGTQNDVSILFRRLG